MKNYFYLSLIFILSCYQTVDKPDNLIDKTTMVEIISDLYLYKQVNTVDYKPVAPDFNAINGFIAQKYKITPVQFKESYSYYLLDNKTMIELMNQVKSNFKKQLEELKNENIE